MSIRARARRAPRQAPSARRAQPGTDHTLCRAIEAVQRHLHCRTRRMASDQLVWQLVKGHNCFQKKSVNNTWLSSEPGNLYAKNSYKYSGVRWTVTVCCLEVAKTESNCVLRLHRGILADLGIAA